MTPGSTLWIAGKNSSEKAIRAVQTRTDEMACLLGGVMKIADDRTIRQLAALEAKKADYTSTTGSLISPVL